jgi:phosphate-selective porin OprO/OprP
VLVTSQYLLATWTVTGESRGYKASQGIPGMVTPTAGTGAWELVLRAERNAVDPDDEDTRKARTLLAGVNYYANPYVKLMFNVSHVTTSDLVNPPQDDDALVVSARVQVAL